MSTRFNARRRLIVVRGDIQGPAGTAVFRLVLDTGSTRTVLDGALSNSIGLVPDHNLPLVTMTTVTGVVQLPQARATRIVALGQKRYDSIVIIHDFSGTRFDGLLGLDFFRRRRLTIDFPAGTIELV